jgi:sugar lactone lactonase YvrE
MPIHRLPALTLLACAAALAACGDNTSSPESPSPGGASDAAKDQGGGPVEGGAAADAAKDTGAPQGDDAAPQDSGGTGDDAAAEAGGDDGGAMDGGTAGDSAPGPEGGTGMVTCGTTPAALDVTKLGKIEQLSVGPDGTFYFSPSPFSSSIGRYAPPYTTVENAWKQVPDANAQILGIALDPKRGVLYAGSRVTNKLYVVPLDSTPATVMVALPDNAFNGATLGEDGDVYYTNQSATAAGANVYRIGPNDSAPIKVNTSPLLNGNDLAFGPDGWLYVNQWSNPATITRLQLQNGAEVARELYATLTNQHGDGIAFDSAGNLYALAQGLYKVTPAKQVTLLPTPGVTPSSGLEFGCGAVSCNDLFVANRGGVAKMTMPDPGMNVPWHRQ